MSSILLVAPLDGGVGDHAAGAARELERRGFVVRRRTIERGPRAAWRGLALAVRESRSLRRASVVHVELGRLDDGIFWFVLLASLRSSRILVLAHDAPDVLHAPAAALVPWQGVWAERLGYRLLGPMLDGYLRRRFNARVEVGAVLTAAASKAWHASGVREVVLVRQGADPPTSSAIPPSKGTYVLFAGFIGPTKGLDLLLDVWAEASAGSELQLVVAGGNAGENAPSYAATLFARTVGMERVHWAGSVDALTLTGLFANAAIVCLPYRSSNPASAILVRAMVEGRAIVATDVPAIRDAVSEDAALIVRPRDPAGLASALRRVIQDVDLRDRIGSAAAAEAAARFSWTFEVDDLVGAYKLLHPELRRGSETSLDRDGHDRAQPRSQPDAGDRDLVEPGR